jgi:hypothetical protein
MASVSGLSKTVGWKMCEVSLRIRCSGAHPVLPVDRPGGGGGGVKIKIKIELLISKIVF